MVFSNDQKNRKEDKPLSVCPICRSPYDLDEASLLENSENVYLLYKKCDDCGGSIVSAVFYTDAGISSMGLVTDLTREDIDRLKNATKVSQEEVLDFCKYLAR